MVRPSSPTPSCPVGTILLKTVGRDELVRAIKAADNGQGYLQAEITRPVLTRFSRTYEEWSDIHLSPRETEVLQLVADGLSNKQIASSLEISEATVKTYVTALFEKLGAVHRAHAVALALRHHLID
jgi:DNA-binding NarL/FixJ family response regulator